MQSTFEAFHVRVGELACSRWEFPDEIVKAVACHHDAERARESVLASVLYSANIIVKVIAAESADADEDSTLMSISGDQLLLETLGGRDGARKVLGQLRRLLAERRPTPEHA